MLVAHCEDCLLLVSFQIRLNFWLLFLQGVFCNPEEAESNRHRPGSEREGYYLYGSHGLSPWRPPAGGAAGCFGDFPGEVKEWDHQTDSSSDHHPHLCFLIKGSAWLLFRGPTNNFVSFLHSFCFFFLSRSTCRPSCLKLWPCWDLSWGRTSVLWSSARWRVWTLWSRITLPASNLQRWILCWVNFLLWWTRATCTCHRYIKLLPPCTLLKSLVYLFVSVQGDLDKWSQDSFFF